MISIISLHVYLFYRVVFLLLLNVTSSINAFSSSFSYHDFDSLYSHVFFFFIFRLEDFWSGTSVEGARAWPY